MGAQIDISNSQRDLQSKIESCGLPVELADFTDHFNRHKREPVQHLITEDEIKNNITINHYENMVKGYGYK